MESDIKFIFKEKAILVIFVIILTYFVFFVTGQKNYIVTGFIFTIISILDYYLKKKRLMHLYDIYEEEQLKQLKYVNWKK